MKRILLLLVAVISLMPAAFAGDKKKKSTAKASYIDSTEIQWLDWNQVQEKMKKEPRKVWVDIYTDWCGWCKRMDATTYKNKELIKYMNTKFYAVRFNAEGKDSIRFMGKMWGFVPENRANQLAIELMHGQMSYPTCIFMEENFQNPSPIPGYHPVDEMEKFLKFLGENIYKTEKFEQFNQSYSPTWTVNN